MCPDPIIEYRIEIDRDEAEALHYCLRESNEKGHECLVLMALAASVLRSQESSEPKSFLLSEKELRYLKNTVPELLAISDIEGFGVPYMFGPYKERVREMIKRLFPEHGADLSGEFFSGRDHS